MVKLPVEWSTPMEVVVWLTGGAAVGWVTGFFKWAWRKTPWGRPCLEPRTDSLGPVPAAHTVPQPPVSSHPLADPDEEEERAFYAAMSVVLVDIERHISPLNSPPHGSTDRAAIKREESAMSEARQTLETLDLARGVHQRVAAQAVLDQVYAVREQFWHWIYTRSAWYASVVADANRENLDTRNSLLGTLQVARQAIKTRTEEMRNERRQHRSR